MAIRTRDLAKLNEASFDFLLNNTEGKITLLSPGSIARALVESANRHLEGFYTALEANMAAVYLSKAQGVYLDLLGDMLGSTRRQAVEARVSATDRVIRFFVRSGLLVDYLPDMTNLTRGVVPEGTEIFNQDGTVKYTVEKATYFPRTATEVFVSARASSVGTKHNIGAFALVRHGLPSSQVQVTNTTAITTGTGAETDAQYRSRLSRILLSNEGPNETRCRLAILSAPGVADVRLVPHLFGAGTFDAIIVPAGNRVALETIQIARSNLRNAVAFGMFFRLREPNYTRFSMVITLTYRPEVLTSERVSVQTNVERAVLDYMGGISLGGEMVMTELGATIRGSDTRVYDYKIQSVCFNGKVQLPHNYRLGPDELFIPDERLEDPIRVL